MSGMSREKFAEELRESFLSVWVDEISGFGTFPIESMKCDTPVIGKIPRMVPEWMGTTDDKGNVTLKENGIWTGNINALPDIVATMVGLFLESGIPPNVTSSMSETSKDYTMDELKTNVESTYGNIVNSRIIELSAMLKHEEAKTQKETEKQTEETSK
jgi:hypothetical protein